MNKKSPDLESADFVTRIRTFLGFEEGSEQTDISELRYVIYARQSTDEGAKKQERSLGDQVYECKRTAERFKLHVIEPALLEDRSAKLSDNRPIFTGMIKEILKGENAKYNAILTWAPDRLARNMKEGGEIIDLLDKDDIKDIKFANGYYFQNDAAGKMMLGIAFVQAKQFSDQHSQNVKRSVNRISAEGKLYGNHTKHGYYRDKHGYARPDGENWETLKKAFEMRLSVNPKYSLTEIATWTGKQGYPVKTKHTDPKPVKIDVKFFSNLFRDPFYAGVLVYGRNIINLSEKFNFKPIITPEEFERLTTESGIHKNFRLANSVKSRDFVKANLMRGMVVCVTCGRNRSTGITSRPTRKGVNNIFYFRCDTPGCRYKGESVRARVILEAAYDFLDSHKINFKQGYEAYLHQMKKQQVKHDAELVKKLKSLQEEHKNYKEKAVGIKGMLIQYKDEPVLFKDFKEDLKQTLEKLAENEKLIAKTTKELDGKKEATRTYEEFIELFDNLANYIRKIKKMEDLDYVIRKVFMNFYVEDKKVTKITQNPLFGDMHFSTDSAVVAPTGIEPVLPH